MARRKKTTVAEDCVCCERLEKKVEELTKTLAKYKKQSTKYRQRLAELENYARETEYLTKMLEQIEEVEEELSDEKMGIDREEDNYVIIHTPVGIKKFPKVDKLTYSIGKKIEKEGVK